MMNLFGQLGLALMLGLLIGIERGWEKRERSEGQRVAGIRTFGLIGLLGGLWGVVAEQLGEVLLGFAFIAFAIVIVVGHLVDVRRNKDYGITTITAGLVTFSLGTITVLGYEAHAAAGAVITATLLSLKPVLHAWLRRIEPEEWHATLKLLLISVVLLPVLPDRGYGPWQALNPYELWWFVVLVAGISFCAFVAMRAVGPHRGIQLTSLLGGLSSSTATTLSLARIARNGQLTRLLAAGILLASATMFVRILVLVAIVNVELVRPLLPSLLAMTAALGAGSLWLWHPRRTAATPSQPPVSNPFRLAPALQFGLLLAVIVFLTEALRVLLGERGIYVASALAGLTDVDAISLTLARLAEVSLATTPAAHAIVLAALVNTLTKGLLAAFVGGITLAARLAPWVLLALLLGAAALWWFG